MAVFNDYLDLRFAVAEHVGNRAISDVMPRFVQQAESWLNRKLRTRDQITDVVLTFTDGIAPLPADFLEMIHLYGLCSKEMHAGTLAQARRTGSRYSTYAIDGTNVLIHGFSGDRDAQYFAKLPTLTTSASTSNWLLEQFPDVYLYAVGLEAAKFLKDVDLAAATDGLLRGALSSVKIDDDRARWSNAVVRVGGFNP